MLLCSSTGTSQKLLWLMTMCMPKNNQCKLRGVICIRLHRHLTSMPNVSASSNACLHATGMLASTTSQGGVHRLRRGTTRSFQSSNLRTCPSRQPLSSKKLLHFHRCNFLLPKMKAVAISSSLVVALFPGDPGRARLHPHHSEGECCLNLYYYWPTDTALARVCSLLGIRIQ